MRSIWLFDVVDLATWRGEAQHALEVLRECDGFESGQVLRNVDEHGTVAVVTTWRDAGSFRRGLGSTRSKMEVWPFLATMRDQPSAFETLDEVSIDEATEFETSVHG
jgi:hypothetical protein